MKSSHLTLVLLGLAAQAFGWYLAPRRAKGLLAGLGLGLGAAWFLWYLADDRSLSVSGIWSLSPVATWICVHLVLVPLIAIEAVARWLGRWRGWARGAGLTLLVVIYGWGLGEAYGAPVITRLDLAFPDLPPAFEGYRIVLVSDLHAGPYAGTRTLGRWARTAAAQGGDLLIGGGDYVAHVEEEAERTGVAFEGLTFPDGKVGILGNHDERADAAKVAARLRRHGWTLLRDEGWTVERGGQRLVLLGARYYREPHEDATTFPWRGRPWPEGFRIGLCHSPQQWPAMLNEGSRLTLAAHTHGGQVNFSPVFNAAEEFTPYVHGLFRQGPATLVVTRGLGTTALPVRFRCRPEIVVVTLHQGR